MPVRIEMGGSRENMLLQDEIQVIDIDAGGGVAVIGGGVAGLQAALDLACLGVPVHLFEREDRLGGTVARLSAILPGMIPPQEILDPMIHGAISHPMITVELNTCITSVEEGDGRYLLSASSSYEEGRMTLERTVEVDAVIIAVGLEPVDPGMIPEFGYGRFHEVITLLELEALIQGWNGDEGAAPAKELGTVVFVQCVGSRVLRRGVPYCSSICCASAIKCAIEIKHLSPGTEVYFLYIDIRTPGKEGEALYRRAREKGIRFIRGQPSMVLSDAETGSSMVCGENTLLRELYQIPADLVVLSTGLALSPQSLKMLRGAHIEFVDEGLPSQDSPPPGVFLAGCIESPKDLWSSVAQGSAAAMGAFRYLRAL